MEKKRISDRFDDDARVAPNARRVATLGQEENKAQRGHETRWNSHYVLHSDESDASSKGNEECAGVQQRNDRLLHD